MDGLFVKAPLRTIAGLVLLVYYCRGQSQLIGSHEPIVARVGDDVILPCHLDPAVDVVDRTLEWSRSDRNNVFVYVWRSRQELVKVKHSSYVGRTSLFTDQLSHGNISLKLSNLKLSDRGTYRCFIVEDKKQTFTQLIVAPDSVALPVISLAGLDKSSGSVELQCKSAGWYPEPEVLWLEGDGNLLSAGPTETVRGPDDLYTVSSRVTVEKKHSNKFTCRVQQKNINQSREALIHVPDDFFLMPSCTAVPIIVGLSVSLAVSIMFSLASGFFWWRRNRTKTKRTLDKPEKDEEKSCSQTEAEGLMKELDGSKSEDVDHQTESRQQSSSSSDHHSFLRNIILGDIDQHCKCIRLKNTSNEEKLLGGWKLQLHINNKELFTYTFDQSFTVKAGGRITLWRPGFGLDHAPSGDLVWRNLKSWNPKDQLQFVLISQTGETKELELPD